MFGVLFEVGWFGFGASRGLIPELRMGIVRFACCRGYFADALKRAADALKSKRKP